MEFPVESRRTDEEQAPGGHQRPAVIVAAGVAKPLGHQLRVLAEGNRPTQRARIQIDRAQRAPRWRNRRIAIGVAPERLAVAAVFQPRRIGHEPRIGPLVPPGDQEVREIADVARAHVGVARHPARAFAHDGLDLVARSSIANADE